MRAQKRQPCWKKLRSRLIHTLTWVNFDYHWLCVWFSSCENRHLTQSRSLGVLHCWPGVKNASAAPNNSVELNWVKSRTSHERNWLNWVRLMWSTAFDAGLRQFVVISENTRVFLCCLLKHIGPKCFCIYELSHSRIGCHFLTYLVYSFYVWVFQSFSFGLFGFFFKYAVTTGNVTW